MSLHPWRCSILALGALALSLALSSCGKVADRNQLQLDSNTNWLVSCQEDTQCSGSLRCYCGQCTQPCAQDTQCSRLSGAVCAESGDAVCGQQASQGGLCVLDCSQDDDCGANFSCNAGQCVPLPTAPSEPRTCRSSAFQDWDQIYALAANDIGRQDTADQPFLRYVSLGDRYLETDCSSSLNAEQQALSKLFNSLSISATLTQPVALNSDQNLFRIDLRDYDWDRAFLVGDQPYIDGWEALVANNPYAVPFIGQDVDALVGATQTSVPLMLASPMLAVATQAELYYALVDIPEDLSTLWLDELGIDRTSVPALQAGFVDGSEYLAQEWPIEVRGGYAWQISEMGRPAGALFDNPFNPPLGEQEVIFTLPNGLHAFAFSTNGGRRLARSPSFSDAVEADGVAVAPRSNLRRHPLRVNVRDEVLDYVLANPGSLDPSLIRQRFPGAAELQLRLRQDYEAFTLPALQSAGVDPGLEEPISLSAYNFDRDVTMARAAAELMVTPEDLLDNLQLLSPVFSVLDSGVMDRNDFTQVYLDSLCILSIVLENQPAPEVCP
ncbi:MAG TPA: hypothetical protein VJU61_12055 [Polyangiaceae bacterium]|nr:hypothetical protein [Polyangiaceae bacterium]